MKKVWIASILTCIILMLPITNVVGANEVVDEDCLECLPVSRVDDVRINLLRLRFLFIRLEVFINIILLKFGHIPEVAKNYQELSDSITTLREKINDLKLGLLDWDFPIFCKFLENLVASIIFICYDGLTYIYVILVTLFPILEYVLWYIFDRFIDMVMGVLFTPIVLLGILFCGWEPWPH